MLVLPKVSFVGRKLYSYFIFGCVRRPPNEFHVKCGLGAAVANVVDVNPCGSSSGQKITGVKRKSLRINKLWIVDGR